MAKLLPILIVLIALIGGGAAGMFLRPPPPEPAEDEAPEPEIVEEAQAVATFRDGFVVPILRDGRVWSHVVLILGVEADRTTRETMLLQEPVLRDGMNEVLFRHGSLGGFDGDFTEPLAMNRLRKRLNEVLQKRLDDPTARVLIVSMARQSG